MARLRRKIPRNPKRCKTSTEAYALHLAKHMTRAEALFWSRLKKRQKIWEHQFLPQQVVQGYIPDFYCESLKLAVEIDGKVHDRKDVKRNDRLRTRRLKKVGVTVVRFRNADVFTHVHRLLDLLEDVCSGYTQLDSDPEPDHER